MLVEKSAIAIKCKVRNMHPINAQRNASSKSVQMRLMNASKNALRNAYFQSSNLWRPWRYVLSSSHRQELVVLAVREADKREVVTGERLCKA